MSGEGSDVFAGMWGAGAGAQLRVVAQQPRSPALPPTCEKWSTS